MSQRYHLALTAEERTALSQIIASGPERLKRRARIVLMTADEIPQVTIAASVNLSDRQVRRWQRAFLARRMAIFEPQKRGNRLRRRNAGTPPAASDAEAATRAVNLSAGAPPSAEPALSTVTEAEQSEPASPPPRRVPGTTEPRRELRLDDTPGVLPDDLMAEAGRKVLYFHFERMLLHEPGSRLGEDIEAVHDMRVATRRMRSAFRIFTPFYDPKVTRPLIKGLRRIARALGEVRDLDVFLEKLGHYQDQLSEADRATLAPLVENCLARREHARNTLIAQLDSRAFRNFVDKFDQFVSTPGMGALPPLPAQDGQSPPAYQVRHVVPRLIYTTYEAVRAYETVLDHARIETLHALRIDFKRLRYTLEFFQEVLGPEAQTVIKEVKGMQDHLGDLNDAQVAGAFLQQFIADYERQQASLLISERHSIQQVVQYMAYQFAEKHRLMTTFPEAWQQFTREEIRRALALAVAAL
ncbi:MAG: hypothetical protein Kow0077_03480 [Anaerolineae bacterium]